MTIKLQARGRGRLSIAFQLVVACATALLVGCRSPQADSPRDLESETTKADPANQPSDSNAPPKAALTPVDPNSIEGLLAQAQREAERGDTVGALITLHQVRLRDEWHLGANLAYQDLMIKAGRLAKVYDEYRLLYSQDMEHGTALFFMLRPMLMDAKLTVLDLEIGDQAANQRAIRASELYAKCIDAVESSKDLAILKPTFDQLFAVEPLHVDGNVLWQDLVFALAGGYVDELDDEAVAAAEKRYYESVDAMQTYYETLLAKHEANGDARYLYERVAMRQGLGESTTRLARQYLTGVESYWMVFGLGEAAQLWAENVPQRSASPEDVIRADREYTSMHLLAELCYTACIKADAKLSAQAHYRRALSRHATDRLDLALEDFAAASELFHGANDDVYFDWIGALFEAGRKLNALELAQKAASNIPDNPDFLGIQVLLLRELERHEEALTLAKKMLSEYKLSDTDRNLFEEYVRERESRAKAPSK